MCVLTSRSVGSGRQAGPRVMELGRRALVTGGGAAGIGAHPDEQAGSEPALVAIGERDHGPQLVGSSGASVGRLGAVGLHGRAYSRLWA